MLFLLSIVISTNKTEAAVQDTNEGTSNVQWEDENFGESICNALKKEEVTYADIEGITGISIDSQYVVKLDWKDKTEEWDIDKDGLKELLVTDGREQVGNSPTKAYAYTYTRGKLRYAGEIGSPMSGISYNCITKRLHASWGGCGNVEYWYYTLTKNKKVKQVICGAYVNGVKNGNVQYKCLYNKKKISLKKWKQITNRWIKQTSTLKYYRNTTSNRKKHMKM